jgi:hypothetical protein
VAGFGSWFKIAEHVDDIERSDLMLVEDFH